MSFRDIKNAARQALHEHMKVPAYYIPDPDDLDSAVLVNVRVHTKFKPLGNLPGTPDGMQWESELPKILFFRDDVSMPVNGGIVSVADGEAYYIGPCEEPDGLTITASVTAVALSQTVGLPVPGA